MIESRLSYTWQKIIYWFVFIVFVLILSDVFLLQVHDTKDSIDNFTGETQYSGRHRWNIIYLNTKAGLKIPLPEEGNYNIADTCRLTVNKGFFTNKPVSVDIIEGTYHHHYLTSILDRTDGSVIITVSMILLLISTTLIWIIKKTIIEILLFMLLFVELFFVIEIWI